MQIVGPNEFLKLLAMIAIVSGSFEVDNGVPNNTYCIAEGPQWLQQGGQLSKEQLSNTLRAGPVDGYDDERFIATRDSATELLKSPCHKPSVNLCDMNSRLRDNN